MVATSITINVVTSTIKVTTTVVTSINKRLCQHADDKSLIESTMVWHERRHLAFAVANCVFNLSLLRHCWTMRRWLEAAADCWRGQLYDGKCSFYFNCYFFRTTPTNRDLREKAVYFPPRIGNSYWDRRSLSQIFLLFFNNVIVLALKRAKNCRLF